MGDWLDDWKAIPVWWCETHQTVADGTCRTDPNCDRRQAYVGRYDEDEDA